MWLKQYHKASPSHHHFYRWYGYHSIIWVVYDIVLPTLLNVVLLPLLMMYFKMFNHHV